MTDKSSKSGPSSESGATEAFATQQQQRRVLVMQEAFSGADDDDWTSWLCYFRRCASINSWTDVQRRDFLSVHLRGSALSTLLSLPDAIQNGDFQSLADALTARFVPPERIEPD